MDNLILLTVSILAGFVLRRSGLFGADGPRNLNRLIIYFFIPVIALYHIPKISLQLNLIWLTITPFLIFFGSLLFFQLLSRVVLMNPATKGALMLTAGISSTSFVGFPIFELLYGAEGLAYGVILSLSGTILVFNTAGISTLFYLTSGRNSAWHIAKSILRFPPFICFVVALLLNLLSIPYTPWLDTLLAKLAAPFAVIALLSIGMQIDLQDSRSQWKYLLWGQSYKLLLAPILTYLLIWHVLDMQNLVGRICILGAAIGSMNAMSILTAEKGLNPPLAILMPTVSIPVSIPILFLLDWLLSLF